VERICAMARMVHDAPLVRFQPQYVRVFLVMFLVRYHPSKVLCSVDEQERLLVRLAKGILDDFAEIVCIIQTTKSFFKVPADLCRRFCANLDHYFVFFTKWERESRQPALTQLLSCLVSLYFAFFNHPRDTAAAREVLVNQIHQLRTRALGFYGRGIMDQFDAKLKLGKFGLPPFDPEQFQVLESDPTFFVLNRMEQIQLVQELLLDVNYRSTEEALNWVPLHVYVGSMKATGSNWSGVMLDLMSESPVFDLFIEHYKEIRGRIMNLIPEALKPWAQVNLVDPRRIPLDLSRCVVLVRVMRELMRKVQMPIRTKELDAQWEALGDTEPSPESVVGALKIVLRTVWVTELDYYNLRVVKVRRVMHDHGIVYIEQRFQEILQGGVITMERTLAWVSAAFRAGLASGAVGHSEIWPMTTTMGVVKVLYVGFDTLVFGAELLNNERDFPETLLLDVWRLCSLQRKIRVDVIALGMLFDASRLVARWPDGQDTLRKTAKLLLELEYGVRGMNDDGLHCVGGKSFAERIKEEIPMLEDHSRLERLLDENRGAGTFFYPT
jgi:hypothetical protein